MSDIHDAITSLAAHGKELPVGLTQEMRDEVDKLVRHKHSPVDDRESYVTAQLVYCIWVRPHHDSTCTVSPHRMAPAYVTLRLANPLWFRRLWRRATNRAMLC